MEYKESYIDYVIVDGGGLQFTTVLHHTLGGMPKLLHGGEEGSLDPTKGSSKELFLFFF